MNKTFIIKTLGVALLLLALAGVVRADSATLTLSATATGGGGALSAGDYTLVGAIGQPVVGVSESDDYRLTGGVITGSTAPAPVPQGERLYLPLLKR